MGTQEWQRMFTSTEAPAPVTVKEAGQVRNWGTAPVGTETSYNILLIKKLPRKEVSTNKHLISDSKLLHKIKNKLEGKATTLDCADQKNFRYYAEQKRILILKMSITVLGRGLAPMVPASHGKFFLRRNPVNNFLLQPAGLCRWALLQHWAYIKIVCKPRDITN